MSTSLRHSRPSRQDEGYFAEAIRLIPGNLGEYGEQLAYLQELRSRRGDRKFHRILVVGAGAGHFVQVALGLCAAADMLPLADEDGRLAQAAQDLAADDDANVREAIVERVLRERERLGTDFGDSLLTRAVSVAATGWLCFHCGEQNEAGRSRCGSCDFSGPNPSIHARVAR